MPTKKTNKIVNPLLENEEDKSTSKEAQEAVATPKKVATPVAPVKENADAVLLSDIQVTKNKLDKEPKVMFMVPLAEGEKKGAVHPCFINGYNFNVQKGVMVEIPTSIANLLAEHYKIGMEAGADYRIDNNDAKLEALA